jgi:hypothetical protein
MATKMLATACAVIMLSGLASAAQAEQYWTKNGATQAEFYQTRYSCQLEAANHPIWLGNGASIPNGYLFEACMNAKGWFVR